MLPRAAAVFPRREDQSPGHVAVPRTPEGTELTSFALLHSVILNELIVHQLQEGSNTFSSQRTNTFNESCGYSKNLNIQESWDFTHMTQNAPFSN